MFIVNVSLLSLMIILVLGVLLIAFQPVIGIMLALGAGFFFLAMREKRLGNKEQK